MKTNQRVQPPTYAHQHQTSYVHAHTAGKSVPSYMQMTASFSASRAGLKNQRASHYD